MKISVDINQLPNEQEAEWIAGIVEQCIVEAITTQEKVASTSVHRNGRTWRFVVDPETAGAD
jgi:hypothetical protein